MGVNILKIPRENNSIELPLQRRENKHLQRIRAYHLRPLLKEQLQDVYINNEKNEPWRKARDASKEIGKAY